VQDISAVDHCFEVKKIEVKQKDKNSFVAKQKALYVAARFAFRKLISKILKEDVKIAEKILQKQIQDCVYDYSIDQEKYSNSFYIAEFSYRFSKRKTANLLRDYGVNIDLQEESSLKTIKLIVYAKDFLKHANKLKNLNVSTELFSGEKVIFSIDERNIEKFREFGIKYAQL
jgi:hypothetical protein